MPIINRIGEFAEDMKTWRRHLHQHPELLFDCHETAGFVVERLKEFGVDEIHEGIGQTGVVGIIRGQGDGPVIGLRADMDALPIEEATGLPYASLRPGKMHACGHDGHTTMLLGAARYLAETRNFAGAVALIFQPAEEGGGGGNEMVKEGMMERFDIAQVYALHNWPGLEPGRIELNPGPTMAAADQFDIEVFGKGGHAAYPHKCVDPILIGARIVEALNTLVAREVDPIDTAVVTVGQFLGGTANNIIPDSVKLAGTVRTLNQDTRERLAQRIEEVAKGIAAAAGGRAEMVYHFGYPVTVNDARASSFAESVAREVCGDGNVDAERLPEMGAEDFSYMLNARPGAYVYLGQGESAGLHHPEYDFNDDVSPYGASFFARLVEKAQPVVR